MTEHLAHAACPPTDAADLVAETAEAHTGPWQPNWPDGTTRRILGRDPDTGGVTALLTFPAGYDRADERRLAEDGTPRFEHHSCHEEIVSVAGDYLFGDPPHFRFDAPRYLNHPPHWLHPAHQCSPSGITLLVKNSRPVDFLFEPMPTPWDGEERYAPGCDPSPSSPVTVADLSDLPPEPDEVDLRRRLLWVDQVTGWRTWLVALPAGYRDPRPTDARPGGEEWFVLSGQLSVAGLGGELGDGPDLLGPEGYLCDPTTLRTGWLASPTGATAIHWEKADG